MTNSFKNRVLFSFQDHSPTVYFKLHAAENTENRIERHLLCVDEHIQEDGGLGATRSRDWWVISGWSLQKFPCQKTIKNKDRELRKKEGNCRSQMLLAETSTASSPSHLSLFCRRQMEPEPSSVALQLQVSELIWPPCGGRIGSGCAEDNHPDWEDWMLPGHRESQSERPSITSP